MMPNDPKLRHAGPNDVNREAELERPSRVACSDLLDPSFNIRFRNQKTDDKSNANAAKHPFDAFLSGIIPIYHARMQKCHA